MSVQVFESCVYRCIQRRLSRRFGLDAQQLAAEVPRRLPGRLPSRVCFSGLAGEDAYPVRVMSARGERFGVCFGDMPGKSSVGCVAVGSRGGHPESQRCSRRSVSPGVREGLGEDVGEDIGMVVRADKTVKP